MWILRLFDWLFAKNKSTAKIDKEQDLINEICKYTGEDIGEICGDPDLERRKK